MREIKYIIIHCSATRSDLRYHFKDCQREHILIHRLTDIGYHYYIEQDGKCFRGRPDHQVGVHTAGYNSVSIGICYEGGLSADGIPEDTRTAEQRMALLQLVDDLRQRYPNAIVLGHHDLTPSEMCPCFSVKKEYGQLMNSRS